MLDLSVTIITFFLYKNSTQIIPDMVAKRGIIVIMGLPRNNCPSRRTLAQVTNLLAPGDRIKNLNFLPLLPLLPLLPQLAQRKIYCKKSREANGGGSLVKAAVLVAAESAIALQRQRLGAVARGDL